VDKVIVITGASTGIGAALALEVSRRGAATVLVARREPELTAVAARCGPLAHVAVADVTRRAEMTRVVADTLARVGRIDVWVNNAGQGISRMPSELTGEDVDEMIRVNVKSVLYGCQAILPHFKARGTGQIVNVSSVLARLPVALQRSAYTGAKHFVNGFTAMLRAEVQETHPKIHITLVSPGVVRTEFGVNARHGGVDSRQLPDSQSAEEVAAVIADVIANPQPDIYTRAGWQAKVAAYYASIGVDPA
jgi:NADP-dependent 3-hydroxy acid dehydrogenase YdfG